MGLQLKSVRTFTRTVTIRFPVEKGAVREAKIDAEFKYPENNQLFEETLTNRELLDDVLVGVTGIDDDDGKPLTPADGALAAKNDLCCSQALVLAFYEAINQNPERKNSKRSHAR